MPFLSNLDVVNEMLATLGELPINTLEDGHPYIAPALRILSVASAREQAKSWWFNNELTDLVPDVNGFIYLPNDTIRVDPQAETLNYVQRGRRLYKPFEPSSADKYKFTAKVRCWLIREVPFEDLPIPAQHLISYSAQLDFMKAYDADQNKVQQVAALRNDAWMTLNAEHTRNIGANILQGRAGTSYSLTDRAGTELQYNLNYFPHR